MDRKTLLKNLASGFLPLLIFIAADEFFGLLVSLGIALAVSFIQMGITYFRERKLDKFALLDAGLILILGIVSSLFKNPIFILLKPAVIEFVFLIMIGVTLFSDNPLIIRMSQHYLGGMELGDQQLEMMQRMLYVMFWLFSGHIIMIIAAAFYVGSPDTPGYLSRKEIWAFVSGGFLYILIGGGAIVQFVRTRFKQRQFMKKYADEEWFDIVTPQGTVTGKAPRSLVHGNPDLLHPVVHVHVFNSAGKLWLQKRAQRKKIQPGKWDTSVGGHFSSGENVQQALYREVLEEMGIPHLPTKPLYHYVMRNNVESELVYTFQGLHDGPFQWPADEIETGRFWSISEIKRSLGADVFTPNFEQEFVMLQKIGVIK